MGMTSYLLITGSVGMILFASAAIMMTTNWLERQTQREERLRLTRWLAHLELDTELLFETDNEARMRRYAKADRPLRDRATILQQARDGTASLPPNHNLACLDHGAVKAALNDLFAA